MVYTLSPFILHPVIYGGFAFWVASFAIHESQYSSGTEAHLTSYAINLNKSPFPAVLALSGALTMVASAFQLKQRLQTDSPSDSKFDVLVCIAGVWAMGSALLIIHPALVNIEKEKQDGYHKNAKIAALRSRLSNVRSSTIVLSLFGMAAQMMIVYRSIK